MPKFENVFNLNKAEVTNDIIEDDNSTFRREYDYTG